MASKHGFASSNPDDVIILAGISKSKDNHTTQFNILTTDPNEIIRDFHHRMPVWIHKDDVMAFLHEKQLTVLYDYLTPYTGELTFYECDPYVNNARHEGPQCMASLNSWKQFQRKTFG